MPSRDRCSPRFPLSRDCGCLIPIPFPPFPPHTASTVEMMLPAICRSSERPDGLTGLSPARVRDLQHITSHCISLHRFASRYLVSCVTLAVHLVHISRDVSVV